MKPGKSTTRILEISENGTLGPALQRYFFQYLINQRNLSPRTISAYRDTFKLLVEFFKKRYRRPPDKIRLLDLDSHSILAFLDDLERSRKNGVRSRNARLAAVRSFVRHAAASDPMFLSVAQKVLSIPMKRFERASVKHLTRQQMQLLLDTPGSSRAGFRDRVLLTLMYNTGARVSEIASIKVDDLCLKAKGSIRIRGKGRKQRTIPLWRETTQLLRTWMHQISVAPESPLVPNARGQEMTRSGIESRLRTIVKRAATLDSSLEKHRVSPHVIRHTTAMHLLQSGVDLSVIAMWLGHESIQTSHQYLDADVETKRRALDHMNVPTIRQHKTTRTTSLMTFLSSI